MPDLPSALTDPNNPRVARVLDRIITVQRPAVLGHVRSVRSKHPNAGPDEIIRILERQYLAAVTAGGAAVGATAAIPAVGTVTSVALSGAETFAFLEASALFAQSVTEIHGIAVTDPERARALVMTMMLGSAGSDLVKQLAGQATGRGPGRSAFWGETVTRSLPKAAVGPLVDRLKRSFIRRFLARTGGTVVGRAIPFGIGAVVGGTGNHLLGRRVVQSSREAFGPAPASFPPDLALKIKVSRAQARAERGEEDGRPQRRLGAETGRAGRPMLERFRRRRGDDLWVEDPDASHASEVEDPTPADVAREAAAPEHERG